MKLWMWSATVAVITFLLVFILKPPFLLFILVAVPVLIVGLTVVSFYYSFRPSLRMEPIPERGYADRRRSLDMGAQQWERLGFSRSDGFYLKTIPDSITYVYKHGQPSTYGCVYHFGSRTNIDLVTRLSGDRSLTTNNSKDAGNIPRPPAKMLQVVPGASLDGLWDEHRKALAFLESRGVRAVDVSQAEFRPYFLDSLHEFKNHVLEMPFWPVKLVYWVVTRYGQRYCRRVEDQVRSGFIPAGTV